MATLKERVEQEIVNAFKFKPPARSLPECQRALLEKTLLKRAVENRTENYTERLVLSSLLLFSHNQEEKRRCFLRLEFKKLLLRCHPDSRKKLEKIQARADA